jgi:hypothetical protein
VIFFIPNIHKSGSGSLGVIIPTPGLEQELTARYPLVTEAMETL